MRLRGGFDGGRPVADEGARCARVRHPHAGEHAVRISPGRPQPLPDAADRPGDGVSIRPDRRGVSAALLHGLFVETGGLAGSAPGGGGGGEKNDDVADDRRRA